MVPSFDSFHQPPPLPPVDISKRYVRVRNRLENGLIEFDFSIGWPELIVELLLPPDAFKAFCAANQVEFLPADDTNGPSEASTDS